MGKLSKSFGGITRYQETNQGITFQSEECFGLIEFWNDSIADPYRNIEFGEGQTLWQCLICFECNTEGPPPYRRACQSALVARAWRWCLARHELDPAEILPAKI